MSKDDTVNALVATGGKPQAIIPRDIDSAYRMAQFIAKSKLAPQGLQEPEQILVAIMHGAEIGLPPMASVQKIAVINGRATVWGDAALGLIMSSPSFDDIEECFEGEGDTRVAICKMRRRGKREVVRRFSVADAKKAGLWQTDARVKRYGKDGKQYEKDNDSPWFKYPDRMLQMRARGFCGRDAFPDVLGGLYLQEEMEGVIIDATPVNQTNALADRLAAAKKTEDGFSHEGIKEELDGGHTTEDIDQTNINIVPLNNYSDVTNTEIAADEDWQKPKEFIEPAHVYAEVSGSPETPYVELPLITEDHQPIKEPPLEDRVREAKIEAFRIGYAAFQNGAKRRAIPGEYRDSSELSGAWLSGWDKAKEKSEMF